MAFSLAQNFYDEISHLSGNSKHGNERESPEKGFLFSLKNREEKWHRWDKNVMYFVPVERNNLIYTAKGLSMSNAERDE